MLIEGPEAAGSLSQEVERETTTESDSRDDSTSFQRHSGVLLLGIRMHCCWEYFISNCRVWIKASFTVQTLTSCCKTLTPQNSSHVICTSLSARVSAHNCQNCADDIRFHPWPFTCVLPWHLRTSRLRRLSLSAMLCRPWWHCCATSADSALWSTQFPCRVTSDLEHVAVSS